MSTVLKYALLPMSYAQPKITDAGAVTVLDSSSTTLPQGSSSITVDSVVLQNNAKILYTNLSDPSLNNQVYLLTGLNSQTGAVLTPEQLPGFAGTMPEVGAALWVLEGTSHGGQAMAYAAGSWQGISVSVGA